MNNAFGRVEHRDGVTYIVPGVDVVELPDPHPRSNRSPLQILKDNFEKGRLKGQLRPGRVITIDEPTQPHICDFWKIQVSRVGLKILFERQCASKGSFTGCLKTKSFDLLPEREAALLIRKLRASS